MPFTGDALRRAVLGVRAIALAFAAHLLMGSCGAPSAVRESAAIAEHAAPQSSDDGLAERHPPDAQRSSLGRPVASGAPSSQRGSLLWSSSTVVQDAFLPTFSELAGPRELVFRQKERTAGPGSPWDATQWVYSVSFDPRGLLSIDYGDFAVLGTARNGDAVIERWTVSLPTGSPVLTRSTLPPPGNPIAGPLGAASSSVGGTFVPLSGREGVPSVSREELYRGSDLGEVVGIHADPEAKFLWLLAAEFSDGAGGSSSGGLVRIDLVDPTLPPELVQSIHEVPQLANYRVRGKAHGYMPSGISVVRLLGGVPVGSGDGQVSLNIVWEDDDRDGRPERHVVYGLDPESHWEANYLHELLFPAGLY